MTIRVGFGYDVHAFAPDRPLVLGGITIPFRYGLSGHSDADAVIHAIVDALLGAAALGETRAGKTNPVLSSSTTPTIYFSNMAGASAMSMQPLLPSARSYLLM